MNAVIVVNVANVHQNRSIESELATQAILGVPVTILERAGSWSEILMPDNYRGWIEDRDWVERDYPVTPEVAEVTDLIANLRAAKSSKAAPLALAPIGAVLELIGVDDLWLELKHPDGRPCWLERSRARVRAIAETPTPPTREELIATAKRFSGVPYLWGGVSPFGMDCSGFVQRVYSLHGILLERDARQQFDQGTPVESKADLLPGDLVFFGKPDDHDKTRITHVGMALGEGRFIHAAGSSYVRINALDEDLIASTHHYAGARRYV